MDHVEAMELAAIQKAAQALLSAFASHGAAFAIDQAFARDATVVRFGWGVERGRVAERFVGTAAIAAWLQRSPAGTTFWLRDHGQRLAAGRGVTHYGVRIDGFVGGGRWRLALDADGRVCELEHQPDDLDADIQDETWRVRVEAALATDNALGAQRRASGDETEHSG